MLEKLKTIGIVPGQDFDITKIDPDTAKGLQRAMGAFQIAEKGVKKLKTENGWIVIPKNFANYGTDYETRAGIALIGLGGIWPQDVSYPTAFLDGDDKPLDGAHRYVLHFDKGQSPPNNTTWSVSMYDPQGYYVANAINRYNLAPWMPLQHNARRLARPVHPGESSGRGEKVQLAACARERPVQSHGAHLLADGSGTQRHLQAPAGEKGALNQFLLKGKEYGNQEESRVGGWHRRLAPSGCRHRHLSQGSD